MPVQREMPTLTGRAALELGADTLSPAAISDRAYARSFEHGVVLETKPASVSARVRGPQTDRYPDYVTGWRPSFAAYESGLIEVGNAQS